MAYTKQIWENLPSTNTPVSADRLNHMEDGIYDASLVANSYNESNTNAYSCNYVNNNFEAKGIELYNNSSGTTGNIVLNDSIANYKKIKIYAKKENEYVSAQEFYTNNNNNIDIDFAFNYCGSGILYVCATNYNINNKNMNVTYHYREGLYSNNIGYSSSSNNLSVLKIEGFN